MPYADLHVHSDKSDGTLSCDQIVEHARQNRDIHAIAFADHDTLEGARFASNFGMQDGIRCIPAVEISTKTEHRNIHMLAYFVDTESEPLKELFEHCRASRTKRTLSIADNLHKAGYPVSAQELIDSGQTVNRPLLARLLIERGYANTVDECFATLIGTSSPYYVDVSFPDSVEVIHLVRETGAYAFVAHPAHYHVVDLIGRFAREGMTGLEAFHSLQTPRQSEELKQIAHDLGIAVSGGSDWHGDATHGASLGSAGLDRDAYRRFLNACERDEEF